MTHSAQHETQLIGKLKNKFADHDTTNFNTLDFVSAFGSPLDAIMYAHLFWPAFTALDGMVFLKDVVETNEDIARVRDALRKYSGNRIATQESFNCVEIPSGFFSQRIGETTEEDDRKLAELLSEMWSARLRSVYPGHEFVVRVVEPDESGGEVAVVFFQTR